MNNKLISIQTASEMLGVSKLTLRNWDKAGKLKAYRNPINNYRMYKLEEVEALLTLMESGDTMAVKNYRNSKPRKVPVVHLED